VYATLVGQHWSQPSTAGAQGSMLRRTLGGVLAAVGPIVTRLVRPPEPDDTIPSDPR
jgi:hypothetical protein